ncbi:MAG: hypothetical protein STHCBS139747_000884, partial [Sporothrix thermara]
NHRFDTWLQQHDHAPAHGPTLRPRGHRILHHLLYQRPPQCHVHNHSQLPRRRRRRLHHCAVDAQHGCPLLCNDAHAVGLLRPPDHALQNAEPAHGPALPQARCRRGHDQRHWRPVQCLGQLPLLRWSAFLRGVWLSLGVHVFLFHYHHTLPLPRATPELPARRHARGPAQGYEERCYAAAGGHGLALCRLL